MKTFVTLLAAFSLMGCASAPDLPRLRVGMSREDLRACFGKPLRVEPAPSGGENWYYPFVSWSAPEFDAVATRDEFDPTVSSVSITASSTRGTQECPIHLSADGYVLEPVPDGKIVRK